MQAGGFLVDSAFGRAVELRRDFGDSSACDRRPQPAPSAAGGAAAAGAAAGATAAGAAAEAAGAAATTGGASWEGMDAVPSSSPRAAAATTTISEHLLASTKPAELQLWLTDHDPQPRGPGQMAVAAPPPAGPTCRPNEFLVE